MSKHMKVNELSTEIDEIFVKFSSNRWLLKEAIIQIIARENIITGNRLRKKYGEPERIPDIKQYVQDKQNTGWIIDVPKPWISLTGRHNHD